MIENLIQDLAKSLGQWAYLLVALMAMGETAAFLGFIAPGEFAVIFGGVLAGEGTLSIELLIGIVWAAVVAGDSIGWYIGHRYGRGFAVRYGPKVRLTEERLKKVEDYFHRHGGKTIIAGRWIGFIRPLMPFTAGTSGMPYGRFVPYDVLSAGGWSATFCLLGYFFWRSFTQITSIAGKGTLAFAIALVLFIGTYQAVKRLRDPEQRARFAGWLERQGRKPLLKPVAAVARALWRALLRPLWRFVLHPAWRVVRPPLRFAVARLRPGVLGIDLTTLFAIAAVSIYVLILQINLIDADALVAGDRWARNAAHDIQSGALTALAKTVSVIGSFPFVLVAALLTAGFLLYRGRVLEACALSAGFVGAEVANTIMKAAIERPRPSGGLTGADGWSFPSGHTTISVTYLAIGVVLASSGPTARRLSLVLVGLALTVLIGLSRVYLRVHYLSDVIGGWALGLAAFSICGSVALVIHYLRSSAGGPRAVAASQSESAGG